MRKIRILKSKRCAVVYCKLMQVKSPCSGRIRGYRLVAIVPNRAKYNIRTDTYGPSFRPQYYIAWLGDYIRAPTRDQVQHFENALKAFPFFASTIQWFE